MSLACTRSLFFTVFVAGALVLGVSYYLEYSVGLNACGLCLLQRVCLALLTGICLMAAVQGPGRLGSFLYWFVGLLCSLGGALTAGQQVLLQSHPADHPALCVSDLTDLFAGGPWFSVVRQVFSGTFDCAQRSWTLLDLSIPEWSLLFFVAMTILCVYQLLRLVWIAMRRPLSGESSHQALLND